MKYFAPGVYKNQEDNGLWDVVVPRHNGSLELIESYCTEKQAKHAYCKALISKPTPTPQYVVVSVDIVDGIRCMFLQVTSVLGSKSQMVFWDCKNTWSLDLRRKRLIAPKHNAVLEELYWDYVNRLNGGFEK